MAAVRGMAVLLLRRRVGAGWLRRSVRASAWGSPVVVRMLSRLAVAVSVAAMACW